MPQPHEGIEHYPYEAPNTPELGAYYWGVSLEQAATYLQQVAANTMLTAGMMFQVYLPDDRGGRIRGVLAAVSSGASTVLQRENDQAVRSGHRFWVPHWMEFDCWWYPGMTVLNFSGMHDSAFHGQRVSGGSVRNWFSQSVFRDNPNWWHQYASQELSPWGTAGFTQLMSDVFHVRYWVDVLTGVSKFVYCGIDVYLRICAPDTPADRVSTWYVCYNSISVHHRTFETPDRWWACRYFESFGQRDAWPGVVKDHTGLSLTAKQIRRIALRVRHLYVACGLNLSIEETLQRLPQILFSQGLDLVSCMGSLTLEDSQDDDQVLQDPRSRL